jgi:hypothetical protein
MTISRPKHAWKKHEKEFYSPKQKPALITIPRYKFIRIRGEGNPNKEPFYERIRTLYPIAYHSRPIAVSKEVQVPVMQGKESEKGWI